MNGDNIVRCLKVDEKSVDFIVFAKKIKNKKVEVVLCEVTTGRKTFDDVLQKIRSSGKYILKVFEELGYSVWNFDCIYLGNYKNESRLPICQGFTIPGFWRNDLTSYNYECGVNISQIPDLNFKQFQ